MKFHWGTGIAIFIMIFMIGILTLVFKSFNNNTDLVSEDYYEREINYQKVIDAKANTRPLQLRIEPHLSSGHFAILFPNEESLNGIQGTIHLYRPNDKKLDKTLDMAAQIQSGRLIVPVENLPRGKYEIIIEWEKEGLPYYWQKEIYL